MSEHRRRAPQSQQPQNGGRRPVGPSPSGRGPSGGARPSDGLPPRRTARPQPGGTASHGMGAPGGPVGQPRMTRAEMRRAAQGKGGGGGGRRAGGSGGQPPTGPKPKRFIDYPRWGRSGFRRWLPSWKLVTSTFLFVFGAMTAMVGYAYAHVGIPDPNADSLKQGNIFYWNDGKTVMARTGFNRQNVQLGDVPLTVQHDFMAAEDETFQTNSGVDPMSILRAVKNMATGGSVQSGSTITQQFVKNVYLNSAQTATRKFSEILISIKIANGGMTKQKVLEGYLNTNYYGRGAYGIEAAAEAYYGVHASQLTLTQGAFIAATVNEPSTMQNVDTDAAAKQRAIGRWQYVLNRMVVNKWMTQAEHDAAFAAGFPMPKKWTPNQDLKGQVGYLVELAQNYAETHSGGALTDAKLAQGGYSITTTFDQKRVNALTAAVAKMEAKNIDPKKRSADKNVQVGAASVDPSTGAIVAIYGGAGEDKGYFIDNANTFGVPVGSTFKPIVLASAMTNGAVTSPGSSERTPITPDSKYNADDCLKIHDQQGNWLEDKSGTSACPEPDGLLHQANDSTTMFGYRSLRFAMEQSINTPYVQLGEDVGYGHVQRTAESLGLDNKTLQGNSAGFFIGTSTPSAIRMANVYATFAAQGNYHDPYSVSKVTFDGVDQPWSLKPQAQPVLTADVANTVTSVLQGVVQSGTGTNAQALGRPAAGKTGTTDDYKSAWFIGYTPQLSTSVVLYKEDPQKQTLESMKGVGGFPKVFGAVMPTQVWVDYMTGALQGQPIQDFPPAPLLPKGGNESGAPSASPSPTASASASASASSSPSASGSAFPSPSQSNNGGTTSGGCNQILFPCPSSSSTKKHGGTTGGTIGGSGGSSGSASASPATGTTGG